MKHRYKVLPLDEAGPCNDLRRIFDYNTVEEFLDSYHGEAAYDRFEPVFFREGSYYDRIEKRAWYEINYADEWAAVAVNREYFLFILDLLSAETRRLNRECLQAIRTLEIYGFGSPRLRKLYQDEDYIRVKEEAGREIAAWRTRLLKEKD